ncbi:hypothetical protein D3C81_709280 [compost metagenome]
MTYGLIIGSTRPIVSTSLLATSTNFAFDALLCLLIINAVPRTSVISWIFSPLAKRCITSIMARSPLPYISKSAFESIKIERRTLSDQ